MASPFKGVWRWAALTKPAVLAQSILAFGIGLSLAPTPASAQSIMVFAGASLKEAVDEINLRFETSRREKVVASYASSADLARQIENAAPADIFISADLEWMDYLQQRKLIVPGSRRNLLRNRIVLIAPADSRLELTIEPRFPLAAALGNSRLSIADPDSVPAGKYARAALQSLGVWDSVARQLARGDNVRTALNFVARGEAPLGIVYQTDARAEKRVRVVGIFPTATHPAIIYPVAITAESKHRAAAGFNSFLISAEARAIFEKHGFGVEQQ